MKTTQPRRYLVRPNQGLIEPGGSSVVQILLVEKDKTSLLQSYKSLGVAALDNCRDKFLVQSTVPEDASTLKDYENLTTFWQQIQPSTAAVANKKLHVRHRVADGSSSSSSRQPATQRNTASVESMSQPQLVTEIVSLRRKYDELVTFTVNLTAERDMLNNALEQTKRELDSERNGGVLRGGRAAASGTHGKSAASASSMMSYLLFVLLAGLLAGAKLQSMGLMEKVPLVGPSLGGGNEEL